MAKLLIISLRNLHQTGTSKHTVNVDELCTRALPGSCWFRMCITSGSRPWGSRVIGNKQIYRRSILVQIMSHEMENWENQLIWLFSQNSCLKITNRKTIVTTVLITCFSYCTY